MKANIDNKVLEVKVIDANYNENSVEVELLEGNFKGYRAIVKKEDLVQETKKASAKLEVVKFEDENIFGEKTRRTLGFNIIVTGTNAEEVLEEIASYMEKENDEVEFARCPDVEEDKACDGFDIEFTYGQMGKMKKEITELFKEAKKALGIK